MLLALHMAKILFYLAHAVLLAVFFVMSIWRNIHYIYRKAALRLLLLALYPNKLPLVIRDDAARLGKIPRRLSCIVALRPENDENGGVEGLFGDMAELAAWCVSAGIPNLAVYEYTGAAKLQLAELQRCIAKNLRAYYGLQVPAFRISVPRTSHSVASGSDPVLEIRLLSREDGKPAIVDLARTMSELAALSELDPLDISVKMVDKELCALVGPEPDLLICFLPQLDLQDYPPWHIRLTEIFCEPDNNLVNYTVFMRALKSFSRCKVNLGK